MSIVVTGGAGFIGANLVARLCEGAAAFGAADSPVIVIDNLRSSSLARLAPLIEAGKVRFIEGDVRDASLLDRAFSDARYVFHLAADERPSSVERNADYTFTTNALGAHEVLQAAQRANVRRIVFTSSYEVYGEQQHIPVAEDAPLTPRSTAGAAKAAAEMFCRAAAREGAEVVALRLTDVYGPSACASLITTWLMGGLRTGELTIADAEQTHDFIWIGDVVSALVRAALAPRALFAAVGAVPDDLADHGFFVALNVGSGRGLSRAAAAEQVRAALGCPITLHTLPATDPAPSCFVPDIWLLRRTLGLRPEPPLTFLPALAREARAMLGAPPTPPTSTLAQPEAPQQSATAHVASTHRTTPRLLVCGERQPAMLWESV